MPNSQSIWNAILTVCGVALLGCIGWQMSEIAKLKEQAATKAATEFTEDEANQLRRDLTNIMTNIDIRLTLIERDIEWIKILPGLRQNVAKINSSNKPPDPNPEPSLEPDPKPEPELPPPVAMPSGPPQVLPQSQANQSIRYDLRK